MSEDGSIFTAFNARWLRPEEVARTYVPMPEFQKLARHSSSILMGPRGSGKTTLLKMLTPAAINSWRTRRASGEAIPHLSFHAVYVPSDIRWSYELNGVNTADIPSNTVETAQRALVSSTVVIELSKAFESLLADNATSISVCEQLVRRFRVPNAGPTFADFRLGLKEIQGKIRASLNNRSAALPELLGGVAPSLVAHVLDAASLATEIFDEFAPTAAHPTTWALCFDELEIAPVWMQREVVQAVRSTDQRFLLKLTWSPVLPWPLRGLAEHDNDFGIIRLWHSHVRDAERFCDALASSLLKHRVGEGASPDATLGSAILAADDDGTGRPSDDDDRYGRGSEFYAAAKALAEVDTAFRSLLSEHGMNPDDPFLETGANRDKFLRKIRPTVFLREAFWRPNRIRSRKAPRLYWGKEVVYAMSDGNPRWLIGLLNDLLDAPRIENGVISPRDQATVLSSASQRFELRIRTAVSKKPPDSTKGPETIHELVEQMGLYFKSCLLADDTFPLDETGSVIVDEDTPLGVCVLVEKALEIGALVFVGDSADSIVRDIKGSRFRLTFMLAPKYKVLLRNGREVALRQVIREAVDVRQLTMDFISEQAE
jgi:hypothetical protein